LVAISFLRVGYPRVSIRNNLKKSSELDAYIEAQKNLSPKRT